MAVYDVKQRRKYGNYRKGMDKEHPFAQLHQ
jgi:hypothetical protein